MYLTMDLSKASVQEAKKLPKRNEIDNDLWTSSNLGPCNLMTSPSSSTYGRHS